MSLSEAELKARATLFSKLAKIMGEIKDVKKNGWNKQGYAYVTEVDILNEIRDRLAAANVFIFSSSEAQEVDLVNKLGNNKNTILTSVKTSHTFACGDTGATFTVNSQGQGTDSMDKGVFKAITGAMKYMATKNFMIGTEDDPENDEASAPSYQGSKTKTKKSNTASKAASNDGGFGSGKKEKPTESSSAGFGSKKTEDKPATSGFGSKKTETTKPTSGFGTGAATAAAQSTPASSPEEVADVDF